MANLLEGLDPELVALASSFAIKEVTDDTLAELREFILKPFPKEHHVEGIQISKLKVPGPKDAPEVELYTYSPLPPPSSKVYLL